MQFLVVSFPIFASQESLILIIPSDVRNLRLVTLPTILNLISHFFWQSATTGRGSVIYPLTPAGPQVVTALVISSSDVDMLDIAGKPSLKCHFIVRLGCCCQYFNRIRTVSIHSTNNDVYSERERFLGLGQTSNLIHTNLIPAIKFVVATTSKSNWIRLSN